MRSARYVFMVLLIWALGAPGPVWSGSESAKAASSESGEIGGPGQGFRPEGEIAEGEDVPATFGPIVTDTAVPIDKGQFAIQSTIGLSVVTDSFDRNWSRTSAGGDFKTFSMDWEFSYGLMENMEAFVTIPFVYNWADNVDAPGPNGETSSDSGDLGDINLTLKYRLVEETPTMPTITALFSTDFPSGKYKNLNPRKLGTDVSGGGSYVFTPGINVSKYIAPFIVYGNLWYSMPTSYTDDDGKHYPGDFVTVNLAVEYPVTEKWVALLELTSFWGGARLFGPDANDPQQSLFSILPGIEYMATDQLSMALGLSIDLVGKNTDSTVVPLFSLAYAF